MPEQTPPPPTLAEETAAEEFDRLVAEEIDGLPLKEGEIGQFVETIRVELLKRAQEASIDALLALYDSREDEATPVGPTADPAPLKPGDLPAATV